MTGKRRILAMYGFHVAPAISRYNRLRAKGYTMTATNRIVIDPKVMLGKPVIRGTRITVELILRKLGERATEADLLAAYPQLTAEDIQAAILFAADSLAHEEHLIINGAVA